MTAAQADMIRSVVGAVFGPDEAAKVAYDERTVTIDYWWITRTTVTKQTALGPKNRRVFLLEIVAAYDRDGDEPGRTDRIEIATGRLPHVVTTLVGQMAEQKAINAIAQFM